MDQEKIKEGVKLILEGVGEDVTREGLLETPDRIARMYEELFAGLTADASEHLAKTFQVEQACAHGGSICKTSADPGAYDRTDRRCVDAVPESEGSDRSH